MNKQNENLQSNSENPEKNNPPTEQPQKKESYNDYSKEKNNDPTKEGDDKSGKEQQPPTASNNQDGSLSDDAYR
ncbi:MAG: hypothetical protein ABIQ74_08840, partial [Chitinophagales bacterium]